LRVSKRICSICGGDPSECPHDFRQRYQVRGGPGPSGYCAVCLRDDCDDHSPDEEFEVQPGAIITEVAAIEEVSLVAKPTQPDARLTALPVDTSDLERVLGSGFEPGTKVGCSQCLLPCQGYKFLRLTDSST
jgi:hypothetical protein